KIFADAESATTTARRKDVPMETYHSQSSETIAHLGLRPGEEKAGRSGERGPAGWKCSGRSVTSLRDLRRCLPHKGTGAPPRTASHKANILALLKERGPQGVCGSELYSRPDLYGRSPRNRISELRREGVLIEGRARGSADWWYRIVFDRKGFECQSAKPAEKLELAEGRVPVIAGDLPLF